MRHLNKLNNKCILTSNSMLKHINKYWLSQWLKVLKQSHKNSQVDIVHQLLKLGFMKMVVLFKLLLATIWVKTLLKCLVLSLKIKRKRKNLFGKPVGVLLLDQSVLWLCSMVMIKVLYFHQELLRSKLLLFQFHLKVNRHLLMRLVKSWKQLWNNLISEFTMIVETIIIQDGNTTIGSLKVYQSELSLVQRILKRIK